MRKKLIHTYVFYNIDVVQYEAMMQLPDNFYNWSNASYIQSMAPIRRLITESNNYLSGSNISNSFFFYIELLHPDKLK